MNVMLPDRGRSANSPLEIPPEGWKDTLKRVKHEVGDDKLSTLSAAMAYYALFAFVPALTSFIVIYAWVSDPSQIGQHIDKLARILPAEAQEILRTQLGTLASKANSTLGISAIGGLLFSLWSASKGSKALMEALNMIYDEKEERGFFKTTGLALLLTFLGTIFGLLALAVVVAVPAFFAQFELGKLFEVGVTAASWLVLLGLFSLYLAFAYRYGPNRAKAKWRWVSWGAVVAAVLWALTSALFSWYAAAFGNFNKTYGSLGAVIGLMMWFYLSSFVILIGAEINAELEHQTAKDSTTGMPRPLGARGARMADTLGRIFLGRKKRRNPVARLLKH